MNMSSKKIIDISDLLSYDDDAERERFLVKTLHFDFMQEIERLMGSHKMTSKELAGKLGVSQSFVSQLFKGNKLLNLTVLHRIQKVFDIRFRLESGFKTKTNTIIVTLQRHDKN